MKVLSIIQDVKRKFGKYLSNSQCHFGTKNPPNLKCNICICMEILRGIQIISCQGAIFDIKRSSYI